jgi:hypothetical protein
VGAQYGVIFSLVLMSILLPLILQTVVAPVTSNGTPVNPPYCDFNDPNIGFDLNDPNCVTQGGAQQTVTIASCQKINFASTDCSNLQLTVANGKATCGAGFLSGGIAGEAASASLSSGSPIPMIVGLFGGLLTGAGIGCGILPAASPQLTNTVGNAINGVPILGDFAKAMNFLVGLMFDFVRFAIDTASYELALAAQLPGIGVIVIVIQTMTLIMLGYTGLRLGRGGG